MDLSRLPRPAAAIALALLAIAPAATAHSTYYSTDGKLRVVTGQLNEPVITYSKTGLDLCVTRTTTAREPVTVDAAQATATLVSPNGQRLSQTLRGQFGRPGCYQFQDPYVLTVPGQYTIEVAGTINGTTVDLKGMLAGGAVGDQGIFTFPGTQVPSLEQLAARNQALEATQTAQGRTIAQLQQDLAAARSDISALRSSPAATTTKDAAGPAAPLLAVALVALAAALVAARPRA